MFKKVGELSRKILTHLVKNETTNTIIPFTRGPYNKNVTIYMLEQRKDARRR